jgi:glycine/D-amino acid oxidase-like deaminating enzyme/nitrite reductase/ring-hydroxylating ferredoxin subunit
MHDTTTQRGSFWLATTPGEPTHPVLADGARAEVAVLGGGIAGVTTALLLARAGVDVVLVEARTVGSGVSGATTAKVTSAHGECYGPLTSRISAETARAYGEANQRALHWMGDLVSSEGIDCDWRVKQAWTYTTEAKQESTIVEEAEASAASGLPATLERSAPLPFDVVAAVRVAGQAECHGRKYVLGLAELAERAGARIYEETRVQGVSAGTPCEVRTDHGTLRADRVVVATHYPILDRGLYFARLSAERSYCIGARVTGDVPTDMYYGLDSSPRSTRTTPLPDGGELFIVGGEGHDTGKDPDSGERYRALYEWAREHFAIEHHSLYRWSAQDNTAPDGIPYAGPLLPRSDRLFVLAGFRKWGFTNATAGAHDVAARLLGDELPNGELFNPARLHVRASVGHLAKENLSVAVRYGQDRIANRLKGPSKAEELAYGEGAVVSVDGKRAAAYRDGDGVLHAVSPTCTHMGCEVRFNPAERSWDCPCHGSRFAVDGAVLEGPAVKPLKPVGD